LIRTSFYTIPMGSLLFPSSLFFHFPLLKKVCMDGKILASARVFFSLALPPFFHSRFAFSDPSELLSGALGNTSPVEASIRRD